VPISKDVSDEYVEVSPKEVLPEVDYLNSPSNPPKVESLTLQNALNGFFSPQILNLIVYIKHHKHISRGENLPITILVRGTGRAWTSLKRRFYS
jgi:hypothetical protein